MKRPAQPRPLLGIVAVLATATTMLTIGCGAAHPTSALCRRDDQCGGGACVAGTCLPREAPPTSWNIEVVPKTDSASGFTELLGASGPSDAFDLAVTSTVTLTGTLSFDDNSAPLKTAHVVFKTPAMIAGRPDIQYETDLLPVTAKLPAPTFTLSVPANLVGRTASLDLLPTPPDDLSHAPATFTVAVATALSLAVSSKTFAVQGRLLSALGDPVGGLVARAFQGSALVSNVVKTTTGATNASDGVIV